MKMKIIEWNIHKMTNDILVKQYVVDAILEAHADIIVLTEYLTDSLIENALNDNYYYEESDTITGNKVFIAVKKEVAPKGICVKEKNELRDCYNFLHVDIRLKNDIVLSVIGIRMLSPIDAEKQTPSLNRYLLQLDNPFICTGDFNILRHRMSKWFPGIAMSNIIKTERSLSDSSYVYVEKKTPIISGFGAVDHMLHSNSIVANSIYDWDYITKDVVYPCIDDIKVGGTWYIPVAHPDHALMNSSIEFID